MKTSAAKRVLALCGIAIAMLSASRVARADQPATPAAEDPVVRARELFVRGAALVREGRYADALPLLEQSSRLHPHATTTYNIGYCERVLEHLTRARMYFRRALEGNEKRGARELGPELVKAANDFLVEMEARLAAPRIAIPPDVSLAVDGRPLEAATPSRLVAGTRDFGPGEIPPATRFELLIDPGHHTVALRSADGATRTLEIDLAPQSMREVAFERPVALSPVAPLPKNAATTEPDRLRRTSAIAVGGAGVVILGVGIVLAANASSSWSAAQDACPDPARCPDDRGFDLSASARRDGNLATAALVTGAAALVGAAVLWLTAPTKSP